jgi:aerobic carbon-monoxide dehydrogenase medium subunit
MIKDFEYLAPKTLAEALSLLAKYKEKAKIIAGGQSLLVVMKQGLLETEYLIDIKGLSELNYIKFDKNDGLRIGALTIHRDLETSNVIKKHYPVISEMEENLAVVQTRNWGTIGGNISHADPAGDPAVVFAALKAKLKIASSKGERIADMDSFSKDYLETDLKYGELLTEIMIPPIPANTGVAQRKLMVQKGDMGIVGAAASVTLNPSDKTCKEVIIALSNCGNIPVRVKGAEKSLIGKAINEKTLAEAGEIASREVDPPTDVHGTAPYRKEMVKVFVKRAVQAAADRAI